MNLSKLNEIAIKAALAAGKIIQEYMNEEVQVEQKEGGNTYASQVVTEVDIACEKVILTHLQPTCQEFGLGLLTEESEDNNSRFEKDFFWCIDPLDGTLPFINGQPGFSVSIALVRKDGIPFIGVVYDPSTRIVYNAIKGQGVFKNGKQWGIKNTNDYLTYVTDKKLEDTPRANELESLLNKYYKELNLTGYKEISGAGSVLNAIRVLENSPAIMIKFPKKEKGGGSIWDYAATACIFNELNLPATNFCGTKLDLNRKDSTFMNEEGVVFKNFTFV